MCAGVTTTAFYVRCIPHPLSQFSKIGYSTARRVFLSGLKGAALDKQASPRSFGNDSFGTGIVLVVEEPDTLCKSVSGSVINTVEYGI